MLKIRWTKVLRELWRNKARTVLVVLSIAVGVFAVGTIANSWIILANDLETAYDQTNPASAVLSLEPFDEELVNAVEGTREVAQAEGRRSVVVKLITPDEVINLNLYAVEDFADISISQMTPETGQWPPESREISIERSWAERVGAQPGDKLTIETPDGQTYELTYTGTAHDLHHPSEFVSDLAYGYVTLSTIEYIGLPRTFNQLYLTVAENAGDRDAIADTVAEIRDRTIEAAGFTVFGATIPTNPGDHFGQPIIAAILGVLGVLGVFSLFLSAGLVINTISAVIKQQTKQIGVMKAIGGQQNQILETYLASVIIFGVLSLVVAVPLAVGGTRLLAEFIAGTVNFDILTLGIPPVVLLIEAAVGILVPALASLVPILNGTQITIREAISDYGIDASESETLLDRLVNGVRGIPGTVALALRNTFRRKGRLLLTLGTLTLAGAIFVAVLSVNISLNATFANVLGFIGYDVRISFSEPYRLQRIEREARRIAGVETVEGWLGESAARLRSDGTEGSATRMLAVPPDSAFITPTLSEGRWLQPGDTNAVVINRDYANEETDLTLGDTVRLDIAGRDSEWEIVGIASTQFDGAYLYVPYESLARELNLVGFADLVTFSTSAEDGDAQKAIATNLEDQFKDVGLLVASSSASADFIASFEARFTILTVFLLFMAALLGVVGGLGLAGTMGINVLERVREIGVMRAIGASDGAVIRIILAEGMVIGFFSWILGAIVALPLAKLLSDGVGFAFAGEPLVFAFSIPAAIGWLGLAVGIAALSSYVPARRASNLSIRETLAYE